MTKITVFGQEGKKEDKKEIELCYVFDTLDNEIRRDSIHPSHHDNVVLLGKAYGKDCELIMVWDDDDDYKLIYLGHWNDGVVG